MSCGAVASLSPTDGERVLGTSTKGHASRDRLCATQRGVAPVLVYTRSTYSAHSMNRSGCCPALLTAAVTCFLHPSLGCYHLLGHATKAFGCCLTPLDKMMWVITGKPKSEAAALTRTAGLVSGLAPPSCAALPFHYQPAVLTANAILALRPKGTCCTSPSFRAGWTP